jgi:tetratricopeptide (TPR) repeat protein
LGFGSNKHEVSAHLTDPSQWVDLGNALCGQQRWQEAAEAFRQAVLLSPGNASILSNLSIALLKGGRAAEALQCAKQAFALDHSSAAICANLGACLIAQRRWSDAIQAYQAAVERDPTNADVWCNLGLAFQSQGSFDDAVDCFRRAIALNPRHAEAHGMLGNAFKNTGRTEEAIDCYRQALALNPLLANVHNRLGLALELQGRLNEAAACYRRAIEIEPDSFEAHMSLSALLLLTGDFEHGWAEYDWWWKKMRPRDYSRPRWNGESLIGKKILLHPEQGLGDTIQFIRYAPLVKSLGAAVIVECQKPLRKLLARCRAIDQLVESGDDLPVFDFYAPLLSLPRILKTTLDTIPAEVPYLFADDALVMEWRARLEAVLGARNQPAAQVSPGLSDLHWVGINWRGSGDYRRQRDIPLHMFASLAQIPGVRLVSLQKVPGEEAPAGAGPMIHDLGEFDTSHGPFMDTAAIMMNLDLVITSDTSIAHLAGALGVPVWVGLPFVPDWRWMLERSDSPWYPTMRLFRQKKPGNWAGVFEEIGAALAERVQSSRFEVQG